MSEEEFSPEWGGKESPLAIPDGVHFLSIEILNVELPREGAEKPFLNLFYVVRGGEYDGFRNSFRLYITQNGRRWAQWFLRKFGYPEELLSGERPVIRRLAIEGLFGKIQVEVGEGVYGQKVDVKGFERHNETELEDRLARQMAGEIPFPKDPEEPSIDIHGDVVEEPAADLSFLDQEDLPVFERQPREPGEYVATDEDLPDIFKEES